MSANQWVNSTFIGLALLASAWQGAERAAPGFKKTAMDGRVFELDKLKGEVVVLNLWFTACAPCIAEMPALNKLVEAQKDVVFLAFAPDSKEDVAKFLENHEFKYHVIPDAGDVIVGGYLSPTSGLSFPTHVVIDKAGKIVFQESGSDQLEKLKAAIEQQLE